MKLKKLNQWMKHTVKKTWKHAVAGSRLTLRGEWIVLCTGALPDGDLTKALGLSGVFAGLRKRVPGLRIDVVPGICDVTVKLFAYDASVPMPDGREALCKELTALFSEAAERVASVPDAQLRLDVVGTLTSDGAQESVRFLNRGTEVAYRLSEGEPPKDAMNRLRRTLAKRNIAKDQEEKEPSA